MELYILLANGRKVSSARNILNGLMSYPEVLQNMAIHLLLLSREIPDVLISEHFLWP